MNISNSGEIILELLLFLNCLSLSCRLGCSEMISASSVSFFKVNKQIALTYFSYPFLLAVVNISLAQFVDGVLKVPENQEESRVEVNLSEAVNLGNVSWSLHITFKLLLFCVCDELCKMPSADFFIAYCRFRYSKVEVLK